MVARAWGSLTNEVSWDSNMGRIGMISRVQTSESLASGYSPSPDLCPPFQAHDRPSHPVSTTSYSLVHRSLGPWAHLLAHPHLDHSRVEELVQLTPSLEITPPTPTTRQAVAGEA